MVGKDIKKIFFSLKEKCGGENLAAKGIMVWVNEV